MSNLTIRDVTRQDLPAVLELNEAALPNVNSLTLSTIEWFAATARYFRVAARDADLAGFLIGLTPDTEYASPNFRWFQRRWDRFVYIDRIVVAASSRGQGVGRSLYADLERFSAPLAPRLACEVNLRPRNDVSLRFHARYGFEQVGSQETEGGTKQVALLLKALGSSPLSDR